MELCLEEMPTEPERLRRLRDRLFARALVGRLPASRSTARPANRPSCGCRAISNVSFACVDGETLLLNVKDVALSTGSACTSANPEPSHVLRSLGCRGGRPQQHPLRPGPIQYGRRSRGSRPTDRRRGFPTANDEQFGLAIRHRRGSARGSIRTCQNQAEIVGLGGGGSRVRFSRRCSVLTGGTGVSPVCRGNTGETPVPPAACANHSLVVCWKSPRGRPIKRTTCDTVIDMIIIGAY